MRTVSASLVRGIVEICVEQGVDRAELVQMLPGGEEFFTKIGNSSAFPRLPACILLKILTKAEELTAKPHIGLICGQQLRQSSIGILGYSLLSCKTLNQVLEIKVRYQELYQQVGNADIIRNGDITILRLGIDDDFAIFPKTHLMIDISMAAHASFGYWLAWYHNTKFKLVHFKREKPSYYDEYEKIFNCPIKFGQNDNRIVFDTEELFLPLPHANEQLLKQNCRIMDKELELLRKGGSAKDIAITILHISDYILTLEELAERMQISTRTLKRRFQAENTSFRQIREQVNKSKCKTMLGAGRPLAEIAKTLGYSQQSSFNRAFKNWFGHTPKQL